MYIIENFKAILRHSNKMSEYLDVAIKIQDAPTTKESSQDLADLLGMIHRMAQHLSKQMEKGIAQEEELNKIAAIVKDLQGVNIYVAPWGTIFESPLTPPI